MAVVVGPRLVWVVNRASWGVVMKQVRRTTGFREVHSRPPGTTAGSVMDLYNFPDGSWPSSTQSDNRRGVVPTVRSEILPIILVIHRKMYPTADSSNHPMDTATDNQVQLDCEKQFGRPRPSE